jgi:inward rectifier potassium channel
MWKKKQHDKHEHRKQSARVQESFRIQPRDANGTGQNEFKDLGLGTRVSSQSERMINRDGSFNVVREGIPFWREFSFYHTLIALPWMQFYLAVLAVFVVINAAFGTLFWLLGHEQFAGLKLDSLAGPWLDMFFFSAQTFTTVGYGHIAPVAPVAGLLASFESLAGLMFFALVTGLLYGRFSRPTAKILFSEQAVIAPYRGGTGFMFRVMNERKNQMIECEVQVNVSMKYPEGHRLPRSFAELQLERRRVDFFPLSWTVVHPIDEKSPFFGLKEDEWAERDPEFLILFKGFDDTFSQTVHTRSSYKWNEVVYGAKFVTPFAPAGDGRTVLDVKKFNEMIRVELATHEKDTVP